ncbi:hypothetical protein [Dactylosporangium salmoneum]
MRKLPAILAALGSAAVFEALTVLATQDKPVRAVSPWQDDPYDVFVSQALLGVPLLAAVILARLPAWRSPGGVDRGQQTARAAGALTLLIGLALGAEWGAVAVRAHAPAWDGRTTALIAGLAVESVLALTVAGLLWRSRSPRGTARAWRHDWLGDVAGRWLSPAVVGWVRRRATVVFAAASVLAGAAVAGAQAIGEGLSDPLLIGWYFAVVVLSKYTFCVLTNAAAGFIARPPRTRAQRVAEVSVVAGTVALALMTAFRDPLWDAVTGGPVTTVPLLVTLTTGAGAAAAALTAVVATVRQPPQWTTVS